MENQKTKELSNFHYTSLSDVGLHRKRNEDSSGYFDTPNGHVFVVCDGCGGMPCGDRASQGVVNSMKTFFTNYYYKVPIDAIKDAINYAHQFLISEGQHDYGCEGMATTVVIVLIRYNKVYYGHVGDSRIYHFSGREFRQITKDDSYVQYLVDKGELKPEDAERHPRKNELMQVMGQLEEAPVPHVCKEPIIPNNGDLLLLCTDGLFNMVPYEDLRATLAQRGYIEEKGAQLMKEALDNGGFDNITFQIIKFFNVEVTAESTSQTPIVEPEEPSPTGRTPLTLALIAMALCVLGVLFYLKESKRQDMVKRQTTEYAVQMVSIPIDSLSNIDSILKNYGIREDKVIFSEENGAGTMSIPVKTIVRAKYYDNVYTLEKLYNTPREKIIRVNNLKDGHIEPDQEIIIPQ